MSKLSKTLFRCFTPLPMALARQFSSREDLAPKVPQANEESNEVNQTVETSTAQGLEPGLASDVFIDRVFLRKFFKWLSII